MAPFSLEEVLMADKPLLIALEGGDGLRERVEAGPAVSLGEILLNEIPECRPISAAAPE
jgi:hypothetical protein